MLVILNFNIYSHARGGALICTALRALLCAAQEVVARIVDMYYILVVLCVSEILIQ